MSFLLGGCAQGPVLRGRVKGLESVVLQAEKNGAVKCAPRELALARSHLEFASVDLSQGEMSNALAHLIFSMYKHAWMPGAYTSPLLLAAALFLLRTTSHCLPARPSTV